MLDAKRLRQAVNRFNTMDGFGSYPEFAEAFGAEITKGEGYNRAVAWLKKNEPLEDEGICHECGKKEV